MVDRREGVASVGGAHGVGTGRDVAEDVRAIVMGHGHVDGLAGGCYGGVLIRPEPGHPAGYLKAEQRVAMGCEADAGDAVVRDGDGAGSGREMTGECNGVTS